MNNGNEPATGFCDSYGNIFPGLTKREYMATALCAAFIAHPNSNATFEQDSSSAVRQADALLAELAKPQENK